MRNTYGASAQAQLFGIPTIRNDTPPVVGFNVDEGMVPPAVGSVSDVVQTNVDLSAAVDSMVEQANSLGKVAAGLIDRATRGDANLIERVGEHKLFSGSEKERGKPFAVQYRSSFWYFKTENEARMFIDRATRGDEDLFTASMLSQLRSEYSKIKTIDPDGPSYTKLINFLDGLSKSRLRQLADAGIPFVSGLARNRSR